MATTCKSIHNNYKYIYCPKCGINLEQNKNICNALSDIYKSYYQKKYGTIHIDEFVKSLDNKIRDNLRENLYIIRESTTNEISFGNLNDIMTKNQIQLTEYNSFKKTIESSATAAYYNINKNCTIFFLYSYNDVINRYKFCMENTTAFGLSIIEEDLYYNIYNQLKQLRLKGLTINLDLINKMIKENS